MKKIKNILIDLKLEGNGIVNMDSNDQRYIYNNEEKSNKKSKRENVSYAKKNFYRDEDGKLIDKIKISRDCILKSVFSDDYINTSPSISHHKHILYSYIASPASILRGYMFVEKSETIKKKGAISLCDAEQYCNAISNIETFSRGQVKTEKDNNDDDVKQKSDTTFYKKENVGDIKYKTKGSIDLCNLQFISCDQTLDRYSFNPDEFEIYKSFLQNQLPDTNLELKYHQFKTSIVKMPEYGLKLSNDNVLFLTKLMLKKLLKMNIIRKGAYAKTESLRIKLVNNPINDTFSNNDNWIEIKTNEDIDNLNYEIENFYEEVSKEDVIKDREIIENKLTKLKEVKKTKKA